MWGGGELIRRREDGSLGVTVGREEEEDAGSDARLEVVCGWRGRLMGQTCDVVEDDAALDDDGCAADGDGVVERLEVDGDGDEVLGPDGGGRGDGWSSGCARCAGLCGFLLLRGVERARRGAGRSGRGAARSGGPGASRRRGWVRGGGRPRCARRSGSRRRRRWRSRRRGRGDGEAEGELEGADGLVVGGGPEGVGGGRRGGWSGTAPTRPTRGLVAADGDGDGLCGETPCRLRRALCGQLRGSAGAAAAAAAKRRLTALDADGGEAEIAGVGEEALALVCLQTGERAVGGDGDDIPFVEERTRWTMGGRMANPRFHRNKNPWDVRSSSFSQLIQYGPSRHFPQTTICPASMSHFCWRA